MVSDEIIDFAEFLADEARKIIKPFYRMDCGVKTKPDNSPVTIADKTAEDVMRKIIRNNFPAHGIIGEEFGNEKEEAEFIWVIDPIDGTKSFISGRPLFGTLIALVQNKKPILGLIDQPITEERWIGANGITKLNFRQVNSRGCSNIADAIFATTSPFLFAEADKTKIEKICAAAKFSLFGGDCYSYAQIANGGVDVVVESGLKPFDALALVPVIEGAGGIVTDWTGKPLTLESDGNIIACGDAKLHKIIIENYL